MNRIFTTVVFDMDGVMIDSEPMQLAAYNVALTPLGVSLNKEDFIRWCVGRKSHENFTFLRDRFNLTESLENLLVAKDAAYQSILRANIHPMPGLFALLDHLTKARYLLAVASSSRLPDIEIVLNGLGIHHRFHAVVSGQEVAHGKPAPDIFLESARRLGVAAADCAVLEDSEVGVEAALCAGMFCIAIPNHFTTSQDFSRAHARIHNLSDALLFISDKLNPI